MNKIFIGLW